ncbi:MAG: hypothetical protein KKD39_04670 [Candidatus Altiarchaeota archaeon]|nr:hypothetical protein [Candidatus Altiarchaeota archaeon]
MAKKKAGGWKEKKIYTVLAPENFERQEIGTSIADEPGKLMGRTVNVTLGELMSDRSKNYLNMIFEIFEVKGDKAGTRFKKFYIPTGYLRSKVRKKTKKIDYKGAVVLADEKVQLRLMVLSRYKVSEIQRSDIKKLLKEVFDECAKDSLDNFLHKVLFGKLGTEVYKKVKVVCPIMRVEAYQVEVIR